MDYEIHHLAIGQVAQAFPLVREFAGELTLERWRDFAAAMVAPAPVGRGVAASGIVAAERLGYIRGLFTYIVIADLSHEQVLLVQNFCVIEVIRRDGVSDALLGEMAKLARQLSCKAIHAILEPGSEWALLQFQRQGHHKAGLSLCNPLLQVPEGQFDHAR